MKKYRRLILPIAIVLVVILAATSFYFYQKARRVNQNNSQVSEEEVKTLVAEVSKIALVPTGETPVIATVSDPEQLKNQPFFIDAKKGYKVLIYTNEKKAILYDPVSRKIVNMAPLNMDSQKLTQPTTTTTPTATTATTTKTADKKQ